MKKENVVRLLSWVMIAVIPVWFGSCKKDGDAVTPSAIEGTWQISGYKISPAFDLFKTGTKTNDLLAAYGQILGQDAVTCLTTTKITFVAGGKITEAPGSKCTASTVGTDVAGANSTWKLDGTKLTITSVSSGTTSTDVYDTALSGNSLKLSQTDSDTDYDGDGKKDTVTLTLEFTKV